MLRNSIPVIWQERMISLIVSCHRVHPLPQDPMDHVRFRAKCWVLFWLCVACCTTVPYYTRVTWRERVKLSRNLVTGCTVYDRVLYAVHGHGCCAVCLCGTV
jgi:hypothetical protein